MKIIYVCPGTGDAFYCENCLRDHALVTGLREFGHDVAIVPMYLPVSMETDQPVMFGAVRLYLIDKYPRLKRMPEKRLKWLDSRPILDMAAGFAGSTRAGGHEEMTLSMIDGESGAFADEFDKTADYLLAQTPDVIFISNAFLLGIASAVKAKNPNVKIVCMLQDEHVWVDAADPRYQNATWKALSEKSKYADVMFAHSGWFRDKAAVLLDISAGRISVIPFGVDTDRYFMAEPSAFSQVTIGYISRVCREMGADVLSEAYCRLLRSGVCKNTSSVEYCGGYTRDDAGVVKDSCRRIIKSGGRARVRKRFDIASRGELLSTLSLLSVPARDGIAFGGFIAESMASGVPVVQPDTGGFSEVVAETGAGLLYSPNTPEALADALERVIRDDALRRSLAAAGRKAAAEKYNAIEMARRVVSVLKGVNCGL